MRAAGHNIGATKLSNITAGNVLTFIAFLAVPLTVFGFWRLIVGLVHLVDAVTRIARKLDEETSTNGATTAAQQTSPVLSEVHEPSLKDVLAAQLVAMNQLIHNQDMHDQAAYVRTNRIIDSIKDLVQAPKDQ